MRPRVADLEDLFRQTVDAAFDLGAATMRARIATKFRPNPIAVGKILATPLREPGMSTPIRAEENRTFRREGMVLRDPRPALLKLVHGVVEKTKAPDPPEGDPGPETKMGDD